LAHSTLEGTKVISVNALQRVADRLSRLDIARAEADALTQAARHIGATVKALACPPSGQGGNGWSGRETGDATAVSHRVDEHSVVIGLTGSSAIMREFGAAARLPDPILSVAASQSGPAIADHIGQMFAQLVSEIRND
jgi:hypothetical protein